MMNNAITVSLQDMEDCWEMLEMVAIDYNRNRISLVQKLVRQDLICADFKITMAQAEDFLLIIMDR